jgi:hypothetical protein
MGALLAQSRHDSLRRTRPHSGVKRTWAFAGIRFRGRYWGQSGRDVLRCERPLMTQSGHPAGANSARVLPWRECEDLHRIEHRREPP